MNNANRRQSQFWVFTINNPEDDDILRFPRNKYQFLIYQYEIGENGTEHIQGYVIMNSNVRFSTMKKMVPRAHFEARLGTHEQAVNYCSKLETRKENTEPTIIGEYIDRRATKNLENKENEKPKSQSLLVKRLLDEGCSMKEVADNSFHMFLKYNRAFHSYRAISVPPRNSKTTCILIYGPTNTGKSSWCQANFPNAYWKPKGKWWDGYEGQDVVIIDEFYGWFGWDYLLRLTDRYPLILEGKAVTGGYQFTSSVIIFTSNKNWTNWYPNIPNCSPLERRLECVWNQHTLNEEPLIEKGISPKEFLNLYESKNLNTIQDLDSFIKYDANTTSDEMSISHFANILQNFESQENEAFPSNDGENIDNCSQSSNHYLD